MARLRLPSHGSPGSSSSASTSPSELWQAAADALPDALAVLDRRGTIITVNQGWRRLARDVGLDPDVGASYVDATSRWAHEASPVDVAQAREVDSMVRRVLSGESPSAWCEYALAGRWFRVTVEPCDRSGAAAVVQHQDVTARLHAEREVVASRKLLDAVTASMDEGLFVLDADGQVRTMNASAERALGWSFAEAEGRVMHELTHYVHPDGTEYPRKQCPIVPAYELAQSVRVLEDTFVVRDGSRLPVAYTASPLESPDGLGGCVVVFMDATHHRREERRLREELGTLSWVRRLEDALEHDGLRLYAQPVVSLPGLEVVQQELLLRVVEPDGTVSLPTPYVDAAERLGMMGRIDRWVARRATEYAAAGATVGINLSAMTLSDLTFVTDLEGWLEGTGADPALLTVEITETSIVSDERSAIAFVHGLHDLGVRVALDDFGAGYGGFTYLKHLPVDVVKIDREFVHDLTSNERSRHVVRAVVDLARSFGLQTLAEGVEGEDVLQVLCCLGVDLAQGFHLGAPAPMTGES